MDEELVLTPGGYRPKSLVQLVAPDHVIDGSEGRLTKVHPTTGEVLADFGAINLSLERAPYMPRNVSMHPLRGLVGLGTGWIVYAEWNNNTGRPITLFKTSWVVPPEPANRSGQTIFLFNGIQNTSMIYQPVLQWGISGAGGGEYWAIASWFTAGIGGPTRYSQLVQVNPGEVLVGMIALSDQSNNLFSYKCEFQGFPNTRLPIQNVSELTYCFETLEAYRLSMSSDYPATSKTSMKSIELKTGSASATLHWQAVNQVTDCGQHAVVVSNASPGGKVDLYYHS